MNTTARSTLVVAILVPCLAAAQAKASRLPSPAAARQADLVRSSAGGRTFTSRGKPYRVLGGARAVARAQGESDEQAVARAGAFPADVVERKGGFLILRGGRGASPTIAAAPDQAGDHTVVVNTRTGRLGIVSGNLNVRMREGADPGALARNHGLALVSAAPRIRAAFFRVPAGRDVQAAAEAMAQERGVASAEVEVLEHLAVPQ